MTNIHIVEAGRAGPFRFRHGGETFRLADPADLDFQLVLAVLHDEDIPGRPVMGHVKADRLFGAWAAHYDLPDYQSANRLAYLVDHYRSALVYDLRTICGVDLGELWRARRWRTLLDLIDHLPGHGWYNAAVANDDEHAEMIAQSLATRESEGEVTPKGPPLQTWTPEVAAIQQTTDAVRYLTYVTAAVGGDKTAKAPAPLPVPSTALTRAMKRATHEERKAKHESLVKRLLPHKR